ncbi:MAG: septum formation inhibitor Maf [Ruminococcus sp.]|nr:septum formation inhibitor Maf [Ruminococcus sp.]
MSYVLASASPRRQELLHQITDDFIVYPADIEEYIPEEITAKQAAQYLSMQKAEVVSKRFPDKIVIGCDTVVVINNTCLGKPTDEKEAYGMLKKLSGRTHTVITGVTLFKGSDKMSFSCETEVTFYTLSSDEITNYIKTGEPLDKAGAYGIQGKGSLLVSKINGDFFNVVGLPVSALYRAISDFKNKLKLN